MLILLTPMLLATVMARSAAAAAPAQSQAPAQASTPAPPLRPIDQTVEDLGPLSISFRNMQVELRQPVGFKDVYRVPGQADMFMRSSGGLAAVFPRSSYANTRNGVVALIPAGTVFHIGLPPAPIERAEPAASPGLQAPLASRIQTRWEARLDVMERTMVQDPEHRRQSGAAPQSDPTPVRAESEGPAPQAPDGVPWVGRTIVNDAEYRDRRVSELLRRAAAAYAQQAAAASDDRLPPR